MSTETDNVAAPIRENPFQMGNRWYWRDETGVFSKPHKTQYSAVKELCAYMDFLENGPNVWQRIWWPVRYTWWPKFKELLRS